jgi:hypothetical protein
VSGVFVMPAVSSVTGVTGVTAVTAVTGVTCRRGQLAAMLAVRRVLRHTVAEGSAIGVN